MKSYVVAIVSVKIRGFAFSEIKVWNIVMSLENVLIGFIIRK